MICVDTTFLIHLWRGKDSPSSAARDVLAAHPGEDFAVPAHAAGEFLEGGASVSPTRLEESLELLRAFRLGDVGLETALHYARIAAHLRRESRLAGKSKPDLWIAAWAVEHASPVATNNTKHFEDVPGLTLLAY
jgi:predicted nucleic acid-binding protein